MDKTLVKIGQPDVIFRSMKITFQGIRLDRPKAKNDEDRHRIKRTHKKPDPNSLTSRQVCQNLVISSFLRLWFLLVLLSALWFIDFAFLVPKSAIVEYNSPRLWQCPFAVRMVSSQKDNFFQNWKSSLKSFPIWFQWKLSLQLIQLRK